MSAAQRMQGLAVLILAAGILACESVELEPLQDEVKIVFVTSSSMNSRFDGVGGADDLCVAAATSAGLPGTYKAWISEADTNSDGMPTNARDPRTDFVRSQIPYARVDGVFVANDWASLSQ